MFYVFAWGRFDNPVIIPDWLGRLNGKVSSSILDKEQLGNMRLLLIDDPEASLASIAIASPVGYFHENAENYPKGVNYLAATKILLDQMSTDSGSISRVGEVEPEVSFWSIQTEEDKLTEGLSALWKSFASLGTQSTKNNLSQLLSFE